MAGKTGITYSQVQAAADALVAEKREPTIMAVRERLRTGSPNTIHRHLMKWREARPEAPAATIDLPQAIIREINGEIQRAASAARAEVEAQLAQALAEAADLSAAGETLEADRDGLTELLAALTSERDVQAGKTAEQAAEIERLSLELERERKAAEEARIEVAQGRLGAQALGRQVEELRADLARLRDESTQERHARIESERNLAGAARGTGRPGRAPGRPPGTGAGGAARTGRPADAAGAQPGCGERCPCRGQRTARPDGGPARHAEADRGRPAW